MKFLPLILCTIMAVTTARLQQHPVDRELEEENDSNDDMFLVPQQYIVMFDKKVDTQETWGNLKKAFSVAPKVLYTYDAHFKGVALAGVTDEDFAMLDAHSSVIVVEQDARLVLDAETVFTQTSPPNWGLDRIDDSSKYSAHYKDYAFDGEYGSDNQGDEVAVVLLDTGVRSTHLDFAVDPEKERNESNSRVKCVFDAFNTDSPHLAGPNMCTDPHGHGTYMAGIIGGTYFGVAKRVQIISVKVFDDAGQGTVASALAGLEFVQGFQDIAADSHRAQKKIIVNMSFGTPHKLVSMVLAVANLSLSNVIVVGSAGNKGEYACNRAPGGLPGVLTVAASTQEDELASFSNHGTCVDVVAPGDRITGLWSRNDRDTTTLSGTSAAAAHATGVAALILQQYPDFEVDEIASIITVLAINGTLVGLDKTPNTPNALLNMAMLHWMPTSKLPSS